MSQTREINLIPDDVIMRERTQVRIRMWAVIILILITVLSGIYVIERRKVGTVDNVIADLSMIKSDMEKKTQQLGILKDKRDRLARKERAINTLLHKRSVSLLFYEVEKAMNDNMWLTSFDFRDDLSLSRSGQGKDSDTWVDTGYMIVTKDGSEGKKDSQHDTHAVTVVLQGIADSKKDVAGFLEQLSASVIFSDVNLMYLLEETIDKHNVVEFKIETYLKNM